jgi:predicted RND superfamily exporter protein
LIPNLDQKLYAAHLHNEREWISLWLPETEAQTHEIKAAFPNVISLRDVVELFPRTLAEELKWMVPLSILLAALIHFVYYRSVSLALIALLPFFTGVGFLTLCTWILHLHISFISVIGLIMIFGFSLDYGIFATDASIATLHSKNENFKPSGMWSAVILAASTTLAGFIPLIFCRHPVLQHLGQTLVFGAIGTFFGAWWAIPGIVNHFQLRTSRAKN